MEKNFKIESMVELRAFAITKAIECLQAYGWSKKELYETSDIIAEYIKGNAELPEAPLPDGALYDYITKMMEEIKNADKMINEIFNDNNIDPNFFKKDNNS